MEDGNPNFKKIKKLRKKKKDAALFSVESELPIFLTLPSPCCCFRSCSLTARVSPSRRWRKNKHPRPGVSQARFVFDGFYYTFEEAVKKRREKENLTSAFHFCYYFPEGNANKSQKPNERVKNIRHFRVFLSERCLPARRPRPICMTYVHELHTTLPGKVRLRYSWVTCAYGALCFSRWQEAGRVARSACIHIQVPHQGRKNLALPDTAHLLPESESEFTFALRAPCLRGGVIYLTPRIS